MTGRGGVTSLWVVRTGSGGDARGGEKKPNFIGSTGNTSDAVGGVSDGARAVRAGADQPGPGEPVGRGGAVRHRAERGAFERDDRRRGQAAAGVQPEPARRGPQA